MAQKSAAGLAAVPATHRRPEPPDELTLDQQEMWRSIVATKPADWFNRDSFPLLVQYCRHQTRAKQIAAMVDGVSESGGNLRTLLTMEREQSAAIASLATKLRLTPQSRYTAQRAATQSDGAGGAKPWEFRGTGS